MRSNPYVYILLKKKQELNNNVDDETFEMLFIANVLSFKEIYSEIEKIILVDELIDNWTCPLIQPKMIEEATSRGYL